jgi:hypothetical protein
VLASRMLTKCLGSLLDTLMIYLEEGWPIGGEGDDAPGVARVGDQGAPHL